MKLPVFNIDLAALKRDPYPVYARMRAEAPICYVPQLDATILSRRDDIYECEKNIEVFSSHQPSGLMNTLMGQNMMRKEGNAHMNERKAFFPAVAPRAVADHWRQVFQAQAETILKTLPEHGEMDLVADYAKRHSGEALKAVTGLTQVSYDDFDAWSQAMIDGIANYAGDPAIEARCNAATAAIDAAITERLREVRKQPDKSLLSIMTSGGMPEDNIRHNLKLTISGGQNEPRDVIAGCVWALLQHPDQLTSVLNGEVKWQQVFEEYCRYIAPVGMSPRRIAKAYSYKGYDFEPESRCFLLFASANRDEDVFETPDRFNIHQNSSKSIAFGAGPHFCAGAWVARCLVSEVALPMLFQHLPKLSLIDPDKADFDGWAFRGLTSLRVNW